MIKKILVPLDGTSLAEKALPYAIRLAHQYDATLLLERVVPVNSFNMASSSPGSLPDINNDSDTDADREAVQDGEVYLARIKEVITNVEHKLSLPLKQVQTMVGYGRAVETISELVGLEKIDLIVMTTHGRNSFGELIIGSTATGVVQHSPVPVMLIRPDRHLAHGEAVPDLKTLLDQPTNLSLDYPAGQGRVIVALDGYGYAETALSIAAELATAFQADLHLLEVNIPPLAVGYVAGVAGYGGFIQNVRQASLEEQNEAAYKYLTTIQERLNEQGLRCIKVVLTGSPPAEIADYADKTATLCIVMATHAPGRVERTFIGSTAQNVLRHTRLPVVMVHPTPTAVGVETPLTRLATATTNPNIIILSPE